MQNQSGIVTGEKPLARNAIVRLQLTSTAKESSMRIVEITREPVELYKILKFEGMVTTGGEAKLLIGDGQVTVNGETETRRRKKIVDGDIIEFRGEKIQMRLV
jgi:ribosome-associated protein